MELNTTIENDFLNLHNNSDDNMEDYEANYTRRYAGRNPYLLVGLIFSYSLIFLLSLVGNSLVIITLIQHRHMRTVTNILLLNLAISDALMAFVCIPTGLTAFIIRKYVFGPFMCPFQRYLQGVCVASSVYTLTTISIERFFAIVTPLWSRGWQTTSHVYKSIVVIWLLAFIVMFPLPLVNRLDWLSGLNVYKCDETWPSYELQLIYSVVQMFLVHNLPLIIMMVSYILIITELIKNKHISRHRHSGSATSTYEISCNNTECTPLYQNSTGKESIALKVIASNATTSSSDAACNRNSRQSQATNNNQSNNLRVISMLIVIVLEFFLCWTPVFVANVWAAIDGYSAAMNISPAIRLVITLMSYCSTCSNPITYCFMNQRFRIYFMRVFRCKKSSSDTIGNTLAGPRSSNVINNRQLHNDHRVNFASR